MEKETQHSLTPLDVCTLIAYEAVSILDAAPDTLDTAKQLNAALLVFSAVRDLRKEANPLWAWVDAEIKIAEQITEDGGESRHLIDPDRLRAVPDAAEQMEVVWTLFDTAAIFKCKLWERLLLLNAAHLLTEIAGMDDLLLTAEPPTMVPRTHALQKELADVRSALQDKMEQPAESPEHTGTDTQESPLVAIEKSRALLHHLIDAQMDMAALRAADDDLSEYIRDTGARVIPLNLAADKSKGTKPAAVILPSGEKVEATTWRKAVAAILRDCDADPQRHERLMAMCGFVSGRQRPMLLDTPKGMDAPVKINDGLYFESKFDTQALLDNLTRKILNRVGYDCGSVTILYRTPKQELVEDKPELIECPALYAGLVM